MIIRILANDFTKNELQSEMRLCVYKPKNVKFFLSSIFSLRVCLTLQAEEQPSQYYLDIDNNSVAKISKRKFYRFQSVCMANRGNDYLDVRTLNLAIYCRDKGKNYP